MKKVILDFKFPKNKTIEYNNTEIEITPFIGIGEQVSLINKYISDYFMRVEGKEYLTPTSPYNYIEAELNQKIYILQTCTNIDFDKLDSNIYVDPAFWEKITNEITNYNEFRDMLYEVVNEVKTKELNESSLAGVIQIFTEKLSGVLDNFSKMNPEDINKMVEETSTLFEKISSLPINKGNEQI